MNKQNGYSLLGLSSSAISRVSCGIKSAYRQLSRWWSLAEQRRRLAMLDDYALKDLGLSRADALQESDRPFWDDPLNK